MPTQAHRQPGAARSETRLPQPAGGARWAAVSSAALVEHVVTQFHQPQRQQLQSLQRLARAVEARQPAHGDYPFGLADLVAAIAQELESHMRKEEQVLFPLLARGEHGQARAPITVMLLEHREHGDEMRRLNLLTRGLCAPRRAGAAWRALYAHLQEFGRDLQAHVLFENQVLFMRAAP